MSKSIILFRNDLRLHDNPLFSQICNASLVLPLYICDTTATTWNYKFSREKEFRKRFLLESLSDLKGRLCALGSDLLVLKGDTLQILRRLMSENDCLYITKQCTFEEQLLERKLCDAFPNVHLVDSRDTLVSKLPFNIQDLPDVFTVFRKMIENNWDRGDSFTDTLSEPSALPLLPVISEQFEVLDLAMERCIDPRSAFPFIGGETGALERLESYARCGAETYKETRNGLVGIDYSTKLSPWLALGCISPKRIMNRLMQSYKLDNSTGVYWIRFELLWRDYFKFVALKFKNRIFLKNGLRDHDIKWDDDHGNLKFQAWCNGQTGIPFVDANMRELAATGYMSNRGRQNVASFLVKDLNIDWRKGAEWFESLLIDHDPAINYGNWLYVAGLGNDPRDRYFNVIKQAQDYDPECAYIITWCPELSHTVCDRNLFHTPWIEPNSKYYSPIVIGRGWGKHVYRSANANKKFGNRGEKIYRKK